MTALIMINVALFRLLQRPTCCQRSLIAALEEEELARLLSGQGAKFICAPLSMIHRTTERERKISILWQAETNSKQSRALQRNAH